MVIGELLTPLLVGPLLTSLLKALRIASPLREGLSVVVLYLALMAGPLLILSLMLRSLGPAPEGGWLLLRWRPLGSGIQRALRSVLMVVPLVSLVGWLQGQIWGDPGGSNPLLDLVLRSQDPATLSCFAFEMHGPPYSALPPVPPSMPRSMRSLSSSATLKCASASR